MTYNVSSGTLNSTIPYHTIPFVAGFHRCLIGCLLAWKVRELTCEVREIRKSQGIEEVRESRGILLMVREK